MDKLFSERVSACALLHICGHIPRAASGLIRATGSADAVFALSKEELHTLLGPACRFRDGIGPKARDEAADELERLSREGYSFISMGEDCYPSTLKECDDAPAGLYVRSSTPVGDLFNHSPSVSIVGTRDISPYGSEWCPRIVGALAGAQSRPVIVSGLAFGVDICAHMAALAYGLPTIAVIPVGIDNVYPRSHSTAAEKIAAAAGSALITDYPPGTHAAAYNFLRRNRIIAGLSGATILIESKTNGGGTMTARLASGYGRDVYALPGRLGDLRSEGCNRLMAEKIAEPVCSPASLVEALGLGCTLRHQPRDLGSEIRQAGLGDEAYTGRLVSLAEAIGSHRGITVDELCRDAGMDYGDVISLVRILECNGFIDIDLMQRCTIHDKKP